MATSAEWHEDYARMSDKALDFSRAVKSVQEELEAVDWYNQRAQATKDEQLRRINPVFDKHMRTYLFTEGDITAIEEKAD